jgi:predicted permease
MATFWKDLQHAGRLLRNSPAFTIATVLILALAIGVNTAMFSIMNTWLLRPLHFPNADQLVMILRYDMTQPDAVPIFPFYRDHADWTGRLHSFQSLGGMFWRTFIVTGGSEAKSIDGMIVTDSMFQTLQVSAELGRVFTANDVSGPPVVLISHPFWQSRFGGARDILRRSLELNGKSYQIIGVMLPSFSLRMENQPFDPGVLALIQPGDDPLYTGASLGPLAIIGRLKPGVGIAAAHAELATLQSSLDASHPDMPKHIGVLMSSLQDDNMRFVKTSLATLTGAVVFVLLIACTNVAGLLLGHTSTRRRELAVRSALGSGRGRLVAQLLTESLVLAVIGGVLGLLLAYAGVRGFVALDPFGQLPPDAISIDARALGFALALVIATTLLFGAAPAWKASRVDPGDFLKSRGAAGAIRMRSGQSALSILQIALSLILLAGAALMGKTLFQLHSQSLGFRGQDITVAELKLPGHRYGANITQTNQFYDRLLSRVANLPGVQSAAVGSVRPMATGPGVYIRVEGQPEPPETGVPNTYQDAVTPRYFDTLSIPLLSGRGFTDRDTPDSPPVAIVSETMAQQLFNGVDPIGKRIRTRKDGPWLTIVGVVGSIRTIFYNTLNAKLTPLVFVPAQQATGLRFNPSGQDVFLFLRARGPVSRSEIRREVDSIDRDVPIGDFMPLPKMVAQVTSQPRMRAAFVGGFAGLALALAAIGIYGLIAQNTAQRTGEIGIRMALGARPGDVLTMVVRQAVAIAAAGIVLGVAGGLALARLLSGFLYGIPATDAAVYVIVAVAVIAAATLAAYLPARRASLVDPLVALRYE